MKSLFRRTHIKHSERQSPLLRMLIGSTLAVCLGTLGTAQEVGRLDAQVQAIVAGVSDASSEPDLSAARALVKLAPDSLSVLLGILSDGVVPSDNGSPANTRLARSQSGTIIEAFRLSPLESVRACLRDEATPKSGVDRRQAALSIYAVAADASDLRIIMRLADAGEPPVLGDEFRAAVQEVLTRDARAYDGLQGIVRSVSPALSPFLATAIGATGSRDGLPALVSLLEIRAGLEVIVLDEINHIAVQNDAPFDADVIDVTRPLIHSRDEVIAKAAISVVGSLEDAESIEDLIDFLSSTSRALRTPAHHALKKISRQRFGRSVSMWQVWYASEFEWREQSSRTALDNLGSADLVEITSAIQELVQHQLFRHELAQELVDLVQHEDANVGRLACLALGQLGSAHALPELEEALDDESIAVQARAALQSIQRNGPARPLAVNR